MGKEERGGVLSPFTPSGKKGGKEGFIALSLSGEWGALYTTPPSCEREEPSYRRRGKRGGGFQYPSPPKKEGKGKTGSTSICVIDGNNRRNMEGEGVSPRAESGLVPDRDGC